MAVEFQSLRKLKKVLIATHAFKKVSNMSCGQMVKITGTICNIPVDNIDVTNLLPTTAESNGLVIVKLKRKLKYQFFLRQ